MEDDLKKMKMKMEDDLKKGGEKKIGQETRLGTSLLGVSWDFIY
jgi:hypothetical protein